MNAVRIHTTLNSDTLRLPELKPFLGKTVEIIVREEPAAPSAISAEHSWVSPLAGSVLRDDDPLGPAVPPEEWEASR